MNTSGLARFLTDLARRAMARNEHLYCKICCLCGPAVTETQQQQGLTETRALTGDLSETGPPYRRQDNRHLVRTP